MKYALITGGTSGIGKNLVLELIKKNYYVYVLSRYKSEKELNKLYGNFRNNIIFYSVNLESIIELKVVINKIQNSINNFDIIILNAGINQLNKNNIITSDGYNKLYQINFISQALLVISIIKYFPTAKYVFISSISSRKQGLFYKMFNTYTMPMTLFKSNKLPFYSYGVSKYLLNIFCREMSILFNADMISVHPGFILTTNMNINRNKTILNLIEKTVVKSNSMENTINYLMNDIILSTKKFDGRYVEYGTEYSNNVYNKIYSENLMANIIEIANKHKINHDLSINKSDDEKHSLLKQILMAYPLIIYLIVFIIIICKLNPSLKGKYLLIFIFICNNLNDILKNLIKEARPSNAKNTGFFIDNKLSESYGMPSGHSLSAWLFATVMYINKNNLDIVKYLFIIFAILVSYSRIQFGVHTSSQVIVGAFLGILCGFLYCFLLNKIKHKPKNKVLFIFIVLIVLLITLYPILQLKSYQRKKKNNFSRVV